MLFRYRKHNIVKHKTSMMSKRGKKVSNTNDISVTSAVDKKVCVYNCHCTDINLPVCVVLYSFMHNHDPVSFSICQHYHSRKWF